METRIARIISYILHPLLLPTYACVLFFSSAFFYTIDSSLETRIWIIVMVFVFTFLIPSLTILAMYFFGMIDSPELEKSNQRTIPLLFTSLSYLGLLYLLKGSGLPDIFLFLIYGSLFILLTGLLINLIFKISQHTLAWGASIAFFSGISVLLGVVYLHIIVFTTILSGLAGYARLRLNAHTPAQVYWGYLTGASVVILLILLV